MCTGSSDKHTVHFLDCHSTVHSFIALCTSPMNTSTCFLLKLVWITKTVYRFMLLSWWRWSYSFVCNVFYQCVCLIRWMVLNRTVSNDVQWVVLIKNFTAMVVLSRRACGTPPVYFQTLPCYISVLLPCSVDLTSSVLLKLHPSHNNASCKIIKVICIKGN